MSIRRFDWIQLIALAALSPLFIFPKPQLWWVFLTIPVLWIVRGIMEKTWWEKTPLDLPLLVFAVSIIASLVRMTDISHSLPKIAGVAFGILIFYAATGVLKTDNLIKWGIAVFLVGGFLFSIIGLLGMPTFKVKHLDFLMKIKDMIPKFNFNLPGAEEGFSTNAVGGTLLLIVPLFFVLTIAAWKKREKSFLYPIWLRTGLTAGLFVTGGVLLLTQSRGAWAGLFIATLFIGLIYLLKMIKSKNARTAVVVVLVLAVIAAGLGISSMTKAEQLSPGLKQVEGTLQFRIHVWNLTVPVIRDNPIWGAGLNNFRKSKEVRFFWSSAHNQFMHVAVEMGIPALIAYLALLIIAGCMCVDTWKKSNDSWIRTVILGLGWGQLAFVFFGITDAIPPGAKVGLLFWLSLALITALYLFDRPLRREDTKEL